eukprot:1553920-Amphidinium_carterae.1
MSDTSSIVIHYMGGSPYDRDTSGKTPIDLARESLPESRVHPHCDRDVFKLESCSTALVQS